MNRWDEIRASAEETIDVAVGSVISFDKFPYETECDKIRVPILGPPRNYAQDGIPIEINPLTGDLRTVPNISFITFERRADGWLRIV